MKRNLARLLVVVSLLWIGDSLAATAKKMKAPTSQQDSWAKIADFGSYATSNTAKVAEGISSLESSGAQMKPMQFMLLDEKYRPLTTKENPAVAHIIQTANKDQLPALVQRGGSIFEDLSQELQREYGIAEKGNKKEPHPALDTAYSVAKRVAWLPVSYNKMRYDLLRDMGKYVTPNVLLVDHASVAPDALEKWEKARLAIPIDPKNAESYTCALGGTLGCQTRYLTGNKAPAENKTPEASQLAFGYTFYKGGSAPGLEPIFAKLKKNPESVTKEEAKQLYESLKVKGKVWGENVAPEELRGLFNKIKGLGSLLPDKFYKQGLFQYAPEEGDMYSEDYLRNLTPERKVALLQARLPEEKGISKSILQKVVADKGTDLVKGTISENVSKNLNLSPDQKQQLQKSVEEARFRGRTYRPMVESATKIKQAFRVHRDYQNTKKAQQRQALLKELDQLNAEIEKFKIDYAGDAGKKLALQALENEFAQAQKAVDQWKQASGKQAGKIPFGKLAAVEQRLAQLRPVSPPPSDESSATGTSAPNSPLQPKNKLPENNLDVTQLENKLETLVQQQGQNKSPVSSASVQDKPEPRDQITEQVTLPISNQEEIKPVIVLPASPGSTTNTVSNVVTTNVVTADGSVNKEQVSDDIGSTGSAASPWSSSSALLAGSTSALIPSVVSAVVAGSTYAAAKKIKAPATALQAKKRQLKTRVLEGARQRVARDKQALSQAWEKLYEKHLAAQQGAAAA